MRGIRILNRVIDILVATFFAAFSLGLLGPGLAERDMFGPKIVWGIWVWWVILITATHMAFEVDSQKEDKPKTI